jgi:hypothetical protein
MWTPDAYQGAPTVGNLSALLQDNILKLSLQDFGDLQTAPEYNFDC